MTQVQETQVDKVEGEKVSFAVGCRPVLAAGETIIENSPEVIGQWDGEGSVLAGADALVVSALQVNVVEVTEAGRETIRVGQGIVGFMAGGSAAVAQPCKVRIVYDTSAGQEGLVADVFMTVRA